MKSKEVSIVITTKGLAMTANWLYREGLLRRKARDRLIWLYESGLESDHPEVRKAWRKMMPAVYKMKGILDAKN